MMASPDLVATSLSYGLNSALQTPQVWPRNTDTRLRSRELQSLANFSWPLLTTWVQEERWDPSESNLADISNRSYNTVPI